jgi:broad specificity phosphatase PhoE
MVFKYFLYKYFFNGSIINRKFSRGFITDRRQGLKLGYLYLVRSGTTEWNKAKRYIGQTDIPLCYEGFLQAVHLASYFFENNENKIDYIVSSPLKRSLDTASVISRLNKLPIEIVYNLSETSFGSWEGLTGQEIREICPKEAAIWFNDPYEAYVPGGENIEVFRTRVTRIFKELEKKAMNSNIVAVSHDGPLRFYLGSCLGLKDYSDCLSLDILPGSISRIACSEISTNLESLASTKHLQEARKSRVG